MSQFAARVAAITGVPVARQRRLAGGDISEVLLLDAPDGRHLVAKGGMAVATEAAMLRTLAGAGLPVPAIESEHDGLLLLEHIPNDGIFSPVAWTAIGRALRRLHSRQGEGYGWPVDYRIGTVDLDNRATDDWPEFWAERRLISAAAILDRPWRERIAAAAGRMPSLLPEAPLPSLLHGDLWSGNILVRDGRLAALVDPACYHGHAEVDIAMLTLFDTPPDEFSEAYGAMEPGWPERRAAYQLFPAIVHLRLFGASYAPLVDRLLRTIGA